MFKKIALTLIFLLFLTLAGMAGYFYKSYQYEKSANKKLCDQLTQQAATASANQAKEVDIASPSAHAITDSWKIYSDANNYYTIKYPSDVKLQAPDNTTVSLVKWGPSQKPQTEFYDGISITVTTGKFKTGETLENVVQNDIAEQQASLGADFKINKPVTAIVINGVSGLTYDGEAAFGNTNHTYFAIDKTNFISIANNTNDPKNQGYEDLATDIIGTLQIPN